MHIGFANFFVFWGEGLKSLGAYADEDFAAVRRIAHALDKLPLLETIENVGYRAGCEASHHGEIAGSYRAVWMRKDEVNALGISRVKADALGDSLMQEDGLRAYFPSQILQPVE